MAKKKSSTQQVLVEIRVPKKMENEFVFQKASELKEVGFELDSGYDPIPAGEPADANLASELDAANEEIVIVRGKIKEDKVNDIRNQKSVVEVWIDTKIEPFG